MAVLLKEPWIRSAWIFLLYFSMVTLGGALAADPGLSEFGAFDSWVIVWVGLVTMLGGVLGAISQFQGVWAFERVAIRFCGIGIATCYVAVFITWYTDPVILTAALSILTAVAASFAWRYYNIRGLDLNPFWHRH